MSKLSEITKLVELVNSYLQDQDDSDTRARMLDAIDSSGFKGSPTMKAVGELQKTGKLRIGLYKELVAFGKRYEEGEFSSDASETSESPEANKGDDPVTEEQAAATEDMPEASTEVEVVMDVLTGKETEKLRERMKKEEEKMRARLAAREAKIVERLRARAEKKAQRQGMKLEHAQKIKDNRERIKSLRTEIAERREHIKVLNDEVKELRPKRVKKDGEGKADGKRAKKGKKAAAAKKPDAVEAQA